MNLKSSSFRLFTILILGITLFISGQLSAQCVGNTAPTNELGIKTFSVKNNSTLGGLFDKSKVANIEVFKGIHYKRYFVNSAFRLAFSYTNYDASEIENCVDCFSTIGEVKGGSVRMGYEIFTIFDRFEPYAAIDMTVTHGFFKGTTTGGIAGSIMDDQRYRTGIGLSPTAGIRCFLSYSFNISAETSLDAMLINTKIQRIQTSPDISNQSSETMNTGLLYHPVSNLSFNVLF